MITISNSRALQMALDFETDSERLARNEWQRAVDCNLHALQDYVMPHQALVWQPGVRKPGPNDAGYRAFNVQITTPDTCTCQRFKLRDRCEHVTFIQRLQADGIKLTQDVPVRAVEIEKDEVAA